MNHVWIVRLQWISTTMIFNLYFLFNYILAFFSLCLFNCGTYSICSKKPLAVSLCDAILLARLREEQWNEVPVKRRRKEIYVLVRNLRSTAYRIALATIVLEKQEEDLVFM